MVGVVLAALVAAGCVGYSFVRHAMAQARAQDAQASASATPTPSDWPSGQQTPSQPETYR